MRSTMFFWKMQVSTSGGQKLIKVFAITCKNTQYNYEIWKRENLAKKNENPLNSLFFKWFLY